jgi:CBS domain-containing protein
MMTARVVTCARGDSSEQVLQKMTDGRFRHIPVMEGDALVGLISIGDVVKAQLADLAMEKDALEGMIKGF